MRTPMVMTGKMKGTSGKSNSMGRETALVL